VFISKKMMIPKFQNSRQRKPKSLRRTSTTQVNSLARWHPTLRHLLDYTVTLGSVLFCLLMMLTRFPGTELLGIGPNWLLIWVVAWSVKRTAFQGALAGVILGFLQDAMTSPDPTHAISLGMIGMITGLIQKQRFIQEDFISIALIVFGMAVFAETIFAIQLVLMGDRNTGDIWGYYQRVTLASAILSSLWAPVVYYPLNRWWQQLKLAEQS